ALVAYGHSVEEHFMAVPGQLAGTAVAVVVLVVAALGRGRWAPAGSGTPRGRTGARLRGRRPGPGAGPSAPEPAAAAAVGPVSAPPPWGVGLAALMVGSLFLGTEHVPGWWSAVAAAALLALAVTVGRRWSRRPGWEPRHRLGAAGGALLAYAWTGFVAVPESAPKQTADYVANAVMAAGAVLLFISAARATARQARAATAIGRGAGGRRAWGG
ncbi:hypothetical protein LE181_30520, partial [Streptomyces sp. SCA3-4]|nr:hypothetical protein [Streptomyces sichuanensis]